MAIKKIIAISSLLGASYSAAAIDSFIISDIKVEGLQRVALGAALTQIPFSVGERVDDYILSRTIKRLYSSGHFDDIEVLVDGSTVIFKVIERPTISEIEFDGNKDIKDEQLNETLERQNVRAGEPLDRTIISEMEKGLLEFFHGVGKYNAKVEAEVVRLPRNRVKLKFTFKEGDPASIRQINIVGNSIFSDEELLEDIETKIDLPWWRFLSDDRYQKQTVKGDIEKITSHYLDAGYLRFQIESNQVSISPDKESVYITLNVKEGEQYTVSGVEYLGDMLGREEFIKAVSPLKIGELYNGSRVTQTEEFIRNFLSRFGYANAKVTTVPETNDQDKSVKLVIQVDPGKKVYVRNIEMAGNTQTADDVFRREMRQMESSWLSNSLLDMSKERIQRLPYIEKVEYEVQPVLGVDDQVDVKYTVKERPAGQFNAGLSYGSFYGLQFNIGVQQSNFLGTGNQVGFDINTSKGSKSFTVSYTDPYFTVDGISLGGRLFYSDLDTSRISQYYTPYQREQYGLGLNFGFPVNEYNRLNFGTQISFEKLSSLQAYEQVQVLRQSFIDPLDPDAPFDFTRYELSASWNRYTLNRGIYPTDGSNTSFGIRATTPNSELNFYTLRFDTKHYFPLSRDHRWAWMARFEASYGNGYGSLNGNEQTLPFWENFYTSDAELRGFDRNSVMPRALYRTPTSIIGPDGTSYQGSPENDTLTQGYRIGGNAKVVTGLELIVPTPFLKEENSSSVRTSFFVDVASVWDTEFDFDKYSQLKYVGSYEGETLTDYSDPSLYRASTGFSIQWLSPMGPMTVSFSKPLKSFEGDKTERISFNIGTTF